MQTIVGNKVENLNFFIEEHRIYVPAKSITEKRKTSGTYAQEDPTSSPPYLEIPDQDPACTPYRQGYIFSRISPPFLEGADLAFVKGTYGFCKIFLQKVIKSILICY